MCPCLHTSEAICDALYKCLYNQDIDCRVSSVTLDNCSSNGAMIGLLEGRQLVLMDGKVLA